MTRKLVVEAIGTFFFVLTMGLVVLGPGAGALSPIPVGAVLAALVYAGAHISGAHYNPVITLAVFLRGQASAREVGGYWIAQMVGGVAAARVSRFMSSEIEGLAFAVEVVPALLAEFLFTFALVFVFLSVATARGARGNSYFGIAIGLTVLTAAYAVGGLSGAALNPALAQAFAQWHVMTPRSIWVLLMGEFLGGVAAAVLFIGLRLGEGKPTTATPAEQEELLPQGEPIE